MDLGLEFNKLSKYNIKTEEEISISIPVLAKKSIKVWTPLISYLTFLNVLNSDSNLNRIFLDGYEPLMNRIKDVSFIMEAPSLTEVDISLSFPPDKIRSQSLKKNLSILQYFWDNFIERIRATSNIRIQEFFQFSHLNKKQWDSLRINNEIEYEQYRTNYSLQTTKEEAQIYQKLIFNREKFIKALNNIVCENLEIINQKYEETICVPELKQTELFVKEDLQALDILKIVPDLEKEEYDDWLSSLSPTDLNFVQDLLTKLNRSKNVAPYEAGNKLDMSTQKIDYFCSLLMKNIPAIEKNETILNYYYSLALNDKPWLLANSDSVTIPALKFMCNNFSYELSEVDMMQIYGRTSKKWIINKMKELERKIPKLKMKVEQKPVILLKLNESRFPPKQAYKSGKTVKKCSKCNYLKKLYVYSGNKQRGVKSFCIASDEINPKKVTKQDENPIWCPLVRNNPITLSKCFNCNKCNPRIQLKDGPKLQCSCDQADNCTCYT